MQGAGWLAAAEQPKQDHAETECGREREIKGARRAGGASKDAGAAEDEPASQPVFFVAFPITWPLSCLAFGVEGVRGALGVLSWAVWALLVVGAPPLGILDDNGRAIAIWFWAAFGLVWAPIPLFFSLPFPIGKFS